MKVVILAGGVGSRLSEETVLKPKPAVEIGPYPIIWHIMQSYSHHGFNEFIICLGYKGYVLKEYFSNYVLHASDVLIDLGRRDVEYLDATRLPPWRVSLIDTGADTMTGGRLKRVAHLLDDDEPFCMTYGDGVADIDLTRLVAHHRASGCEATLTAVRPPGRFGAVVLKDGRVTRFAEKPRGDGGYISGGFFVLDRRVIDRIEGDATLWEREPLEGLAREGRLGAFVHDGFWHPMDTLRDKHYLDERWAAGDAPWKTWD
jgi:glucose-1-phosphate cytidylyltransferase